MAAEPIVVFVLLEVHVDYVRTSTPFSALELCNHAGSHCRYDAMGQIIVCADCFCTDH